MLNSARFVLGSVVNQKDVITVPIVIVYYIARRCNTGPVPALYELLGSVLWYQLGQDYSASALVQGNLRPLSHTCVFASLFFS